ncbi:hypothetical protein [Streptomyces sp. WAC06614]|uniref:hypothetical protein n=1 Tax=Streptomyces sp. WAC06614 TaxID=2487416 RepID=UPI000F78D9FB|nr:hypothetical protein [Streptomyces sp. WAC06614]RSS82538.1 hypothetical protein EF918_06445 [Streptomyces sp. WAC06614]
MRHTVVRRSAVTVSAVSLALLATACGSDKPADKKDEPKSAATSAAPAAKGKTDAEVTALVVTQADLPDQVVSAEGAAKAAGQSAQATVDKADCKPLMQAQSGLKVGAPTGSGRTVTKAKPKELPANASAEDKLKAGLEALAGNQTMVALGSYDAKGAEEAFASLKTAAAACAGGYTVDDGGDKVKFLDVKQGAPVAAGDEAAAFTLTMDLDGGDKSTTHFVVVRKGNALATFYSFGATATQPKSVIDAQVKKLG